MSIGHFIRVGDKTTCGGTVQEGDSGWTIEGQPRAREGDSVTCGVDGETYAIVGGVSYFTSDGRLVAGTLDSHSSCPCKAGLEASVFFASYESSNNAPLATRTAAQLATPAATSSPPAPGQSGFAPLTSHPRPAAFSRSEPQEPGFYIVPKSISREQLEVSLFSVRDPAVMHKFQLLNPNRGDVKAGSMIVLSDPNNLQCTREEALLMEAAAKVNETLKPLSAEEADFIARHHDEIETFLSYGSKAVGVGQGMFNNNLENVKKALRDIEALHQHAFLRDGHLRSKQFFAERKQLLSQLDTHLTSMTRKGVGFPDHPNLRSALGISSRSLVHRWTKAGASSQIPGYATHFEGVVRAGQYVKYGGWIGNAVGAGASYMKVQEVCTAGDTEACKRVKFTEVGSFFGGLGGGAAAGFLFSAGTVAGVCLALGIPTAGVGTLVCSVVVVGAGSIAGGAVGGKFGEAIGEVIYEQTR